MKYPIWVKVTVMILAAYRALKQLDEKPGINPRADLQQLDTLYYSLPVVHGKVWTYLVEQVILWIDREKLNLVILSQIGVKEVGLVQNDL